MQSKGEDTTRFEKTKFMCDYHEKLTQLSERVATLLEEDQFKAVDILTGGGPGERGESASRGRLQGADTPQSRMWNCTPSGASERSRASYFRPSIPS